MTPIFFFLFPFLLLLPLPNFLLESLNRAVDGQQKKRSSPARGTTGCLCRVTRALIDFFTPGSRWHYCTIEVPKWISLCLEGVRRYRSILVESMTGHYFEIWKITQQISPRKETLDKAYLKHISYDVDVIII